MIEMQYNFPLLPGLPAQFRERLAVAVGALGDDNFDELRPTFRSDMTELIAIGAGWMKMPSERTFLTEGNHHGSLLAMMAGGLAGHPFAVDVIAYTGAIEQARALAAPLVACAVDAEGMVPESLDEQCAAAAASGRPVRGMYVIPTVHNPLGCVASLARREALVGVARKWDLLIVEDDAYGYMDPEAPPSIARLAPERTFYVRGLSKSYAPGARAGFLVAPEGFGDRMWAAIKNVVTGVSLVHARVAASFITDGTIDRVIAAKNVEGLARNRAARDLLADDACWPGAAAAWHLWINLPAQVTPQSFEQRMKERGVLISGGNWFAAGPDAPNGFRAALGGEVERERTLEGVRLIAEELGKL
jgi:DNA-binding transcriptional MocR family regulator